MLSFEGRGGAIAALEDIYRRFVFHHPTFRYAAYFPADPLVPVDELVLVDPDPDENVVIPILTLGVGAPIAPCLLLAPVLISSTFNMPPTIMRPLTCPAVPTTEEGA